MFKLFSMLMFVFVVLFGGMNTVQASVAIPDGSTSYMECGETHCIVCDMNGRCHIVKKQKKSNIFDMPTPEVKVAKYIWDCSGPGTKCKICTKNGSKCIYKDKKKVQGNGYAENRRCSVDPVLNRKRCPNGNLTS